MTYLLDTSVVSEVTRTQPRPSVMAWFASQAEEMYFLSVLTIGELYKGISKLAESERKAQLVHWLGHDLIRRFRDRLLPIDLTVARAWGTLQDDSLRTGCPWR